MSILFLHRYQRLNEEDSMKNVNKSKRRGCEEVESQFYKKNVIKTKWKMKRKRQQLCGKCDVMHNEEMNNIGE